MFIPTDRMSGRPRGFAIVEFSSEEEAGTAIERFDGVELAGRNLRINEAEARPPRAPFFPPNDGGPPRGGKGFGKNKGSRRGLRGRKRSL